MATYVKQNMRKVIEVEMRFEAGETFYIVPWSDWHIEAADADEETLQRHAQIVGSTPNAFCFLAGDMVDAISHRDPRFRRTPVKEWYEEATKEEGWEPGQVLADHIAENVLKANGITREKLLGVGEGNHEDAWLKHHHVNISQMIADRMGVVDRFGGYAYDLRLLFKYVKNLKQGTIGSFIFDVHHGWQAGRRDGALANQLELELGFSNADACVRGHVHKRHVFPYGARWIGSKYSRDWLRLGIVSGTYKRGWRGEVPQGQAPSTWEQRRGFRPTATSLMGPPVIVLKPKSSRAAGDAKIDIGWLDSIDRLADVAGTE